MYNKSIMNPFHTFLTPHQKSLQPQSSKQSINSKLNGNKKIKLTSAEQTNMDWDWQIIIKAINNSSTQRLSGDYTKLDQTDLITIISQFVLQSGSKSFKEQNISVRKWCIVQVDQLPLQNKGAIGSKLSNIFKCSNHCDHLKTNDERSQYNIANQIQLPSTIRPYCLILNMAERQLHFQSQQQPNNYFFINLDTIQTQLQKQQPYILQNILKDKQFAKSLLNKPIIIKIINKNQTLTVSLYLTFFTLPFPFKQNPREDQKIRYLLNYRQSLFNLLDQSIKNSRGRQLRMNKIIDMAIKDSKKFYNNRYATEEQFANYCQSGDLILFRDNHTMAKVQRVVTSSPYDHVGVVFKDEKLGICLFQSSSSIGVGLASWKKLIRSRWFENIDKIAWRKLQIHNKPSNFQEKITQFVKGNLHKQFGLSLPKLLKFKSVTYSKDSHKSYFCSQLVAELYIYLGLLVSDKSSTQYWPKDFADQNGIQILNGALDFERQLIFEDSLLKQCYQFYR